MGSIHWPQKMMSALLLPLILMYFLRVLRNERVVPNAAVSGALLGASFLSGHHNVPVFFCLVMAGLWIYYAVALRGGSVRKLSGAAAFVACFGLIAAAQILPTNEFGKLSLRWVNAPSPVAWNETVPYSVHNQFSLHPAALLDIVIPGLERTAFVGLVALGLALFGVISNWRERTVRLLSVIAACGLLFALGGRSLFHGVLYAIVPSLDKARSPDVALVIFDLGVAVLAAYGLDSLRASIVPAAALRIGVRLLAALGLFLYTALIVLVRLRPATDDSYTFLAEAALVALLFAGILQAWRMSWLTIRAASIMAILLLLFELNHVTNYAYEPMATTAKLHQLDDIAAFLKNQPQLPRVDLDEKEVSYDFGDWYGVDELRGALAAALTPFADTQGESQFPALLAANFYIGRRPRTPQQIARFEGKSGLIVFSDPSALPRARIVHSAIGMPNAKAVVSAVANPANDLSRTAILLGPPPALETCEGGDVETTRYRPTSVVLKVNSPCRGMVLLADSWFPDWKALVDGKQAPIYAAYNLIRGVVVDGGNHEVVLLYRPSRVFLGLWMAGLGILLCAALQFGRGRDRLPVPPARIEDVEESPDAKPAALLTKTL